MSWYCRDGTSEGCEPCILQVLPILIASEPFWQMTHSVSSRSKHAETLQTAPPTVDKTLLQYVAASQRSIQQTAHCPGCRGSSIMVSPSTAELVECNSLSHRCMHDVKIHQHMELHIPCLHPMSAAVHLHVSTNQPGSNTPQLALPSSAPRKHLSTLSQDHGVVSACTASKHSLCTSFQQRPGACKLMFKAYSLSIKVRAFKAPQSILMPYVQSTPMNCEASANQRCDASDLCAVSMIQICQVYLLDEHNSHHAHCCCV